MNNDFRALKIKISVYKIEEANWDLSLAFLLLHGKEELGVSLCSSCPCCAWFYIVPFRRQVWNTYTYCDCLALNLCRNTQNTIAQSRRGTKLIPKQGGKITARKQRTLRPDFCKTVMLQKYSCSLMFSVQKRMKNAVCNHLAWKTF